jgi:eukaryotic translation initiation factor 2C
MAAMTVSMDNFGARYAAACETNGYRVEMITTANIDSMLKPLLRHWVQNLNQGRFPDHIYYFRDGVSEGQFQHVLQQEVGDMRKMITGVHPTWEGKFIVIVASKRHHIRFFPGSAGDRNGNPHPGTLVERDVTHPFEYDFYLNSHSAIQGTARPVHYHVLIDEIGLDANKLQKMIYEHSYQYMRSTTPVSLCKSAIPLLGE